jgi:hypothetical protein
MKPNIGQEVKDLKGMTATELREKYLEVFGEETRSWNKNFLLKRIAWRMQAIEEGDLSERARQRAEDLANDADLRVRMPRKMPEREAAAPERTVVRTFCPAEDRRLPMPGAVITREYQGETISVTVLDKGFEYEGKVYRTLTAVAKAVTGAHWNGYHFFGLGKKGGRK